MLFSPKNVPKSKKKTKAATKKKTTKKAAAKKKKEDAIEESVAADDSPVEQPEEKPKKKSFFSFGRKKKQTTVEPSVHKEKGKLAIFLASLNNMGMGKVRVSLIQSMAMMMNAGLPLIETLSVLEREAKGRAVKKMVRGIADEVETGVSLWRAMKNQYMFSPYEIALVRIGEEAGNLARNLEYLSEQQEKDRALKAKVKMAMIYPTIVMVMMFIIVMGLGMFVLPNLIQVLISLNAELPATTQAVIFVTNLFTKYGTIAIPSMIGGFITLVILAKFTSFKVVSQWVMFRIPGIGSLARHATIARFGVILGGLLQAGVPLVSALESLEHVTNVAAYKSFYGKLLVHIKQGDSFSTSFATIKGSNKRLPASVQQLVITGEQSGTLSETLLKIAQIYERKAEETAEKLPTILEPMLLLFIGSLVGVIAFAILTPIYGVVGNVGR